MTAAEIFDGHGSGAFGFRLEIEGWPCFFVTHDMITWSSGADGRAQVVGLQYEGLRTDERVLMAEAQLDCEGIKFKIVPQGLKIVAGSVPTDDATLYLSLEREPADRLAAPVTYNATALTFVSGGTYASGRIIHIGTEALRSTGSGNFTRHIWGTQEQAHPVSTYNQTQHVYVYEDIPPTMEGRRVALYGYGEGENMAGAGRLMWRGMVADVPSTTTDAEGGLSWLIDCEAVTQVLAQDIAGSLVEAHVVGIYHHFSSPFVLWVYWDGRQHGPYYYTRHDPNEADLVRNLATFIDSAIRVDAGAASFIAKVSVGRALGGELQISLLRSSDPADVFKIKGGSPIVGFFDSELEGFVSEDATMTSSGHTAGVFRVDALDPDKYYNVPLSMTCPTFAKKGVTNQYEFQGAPVTGLGNAREVVRDPKGLFVDRSAAATYPAWRVFIDMDLAGATSVVITGTLKDDGIFTVVGAGTSSGKYYIDLQHFTRRHWLFPGGSTFMGYLTGETTITALRQYAIGNVGTFIDGLKTVGRDHANSGDAPFVTDVDVTSFAPEDIVPLAMFRVYNFLKKQRLYDAVKEELKFVGYFMRIEADGTIGFQPLPSWTETFPVDALHTLDANSILTPPDGDWPTWSPNVDGRITQVSLQHSYDWREGKWTDQPVEVHDGRAIAVTKGRGASPLEIKPFSAPLLGYVPGPDNDEWLTRIGKKIVDRLALQYAVVTLSVPYSKLGILCGDIVSVTSPHVLAGDGTRGVTGRRGVVIGKRVNFDPADKERIDLTILLTSKEQVGYAPSAVPLGVTNTSGNTWVLEIELDGGGDDAALNRGMATANTGSPLEHFAPGDHIQLFEALEYTPTVVTGVVNSVNLTANPQTITVTLNSVWAPATTVGEDGLQLVNAWILEFRADNAAGDFSTTPQRRYAYVADSAGGLPSSGYARRLT